MVNKRVLAYTYTCCTVIDFSRNLNDALRPTPLRPYALRPYALRLTPYALRPTPYALRPAPDVYILRLIGGIAETSLNEAVYMICVYVCKA